VVAIGECRIVFFDYKLGQKMKIPDAVRKMMEELEKPPSSGIHVDVA